MILNISYKFIAFSIITAIIFIFFPQLDIMTSGLFFKEGHFFARNYLPFELIYDYAPSMTGIFFLAVLILFVYMQFKKRDQMLGLKKKAYLYLILAMLLGPLLVVNGLLKEFSGRARPRHIVEFSGDKTFTPAFIISDQCKRNCSFVSGHASAGFYFVALSLLFTGRRRKILFWSAVAAGGVIGLVRIIQGGHFLSDVTFSYVFVYLTSLLLHYRMFKNDKAL